MINYHSQLILGTKNHHHHPFLSLLYAFNIGTFFLVIYVYPSSSFPSFVIFLCYLFSFIIFIPFLPKEFTINSSSSLKKSFFKIPSSFKSIHIDSSSIFWVHQILFTLLSLPSKKMIKKLFIFLLPNIFLPVMI